MTPCKPSRLRASGVNTPTILSGNSAVQTLAAAERPPRQSISTCAKRRATRAANVRNSAGQAQNSASQSSRSARSP